MGDDAKNPYAYKMVVNAGMEDAPPPDEHINHSDDGYDNGKKRSTLPTDASELLGGGKVLGRSKKAEEARATARLWIKKYLKSNVESDEGDLYCNMNYPRSFDDFRYAHIEGEGLQQFLNAFGLWLAGNKFWTRQNTWLAVSSKEDYFKNVKEVLKDKYPQHYLFNPGMPDAWFTKMNNHFVRECERTKIEDPEISQERKSEPLYRHLSGDMMDLTEGNNAATSSLRS